MKLYGNTKINVEHILHIYIYRQIDINNDQTKKNISQNTVIILNVNL